MALDYWLAVQRAALTSSLRSADPHWPHFLLIIGHRSSSGCTMAAFRAIVQQQFGAMIKNSMPELIAFSASGLAIGAFAAASIPPFA